MAIGLLAAIESGRAQSVASYRCADGTHFIVGFYPQDARAFLQIDGGEVTLARRLALSGRRYSGAGVMLTITKDGRTLIRHARRPATVCETL
ncbi:MliC family protein [Bradyrhizobium sp. STM 3809]|uniref:MliC family protein n=1 Tax=Bradyrhizobium sp. STM 3809 TaxID=551936 RepID=UPI001F0AE24B|nr:MliC family protein [Bradyrhizobium sp. STM 3809]